MDTIFAQATAQGKAGVAIVRVSGPSAVQACAQIAGFKPSDRTPHLRHLRDEEGQIIDQALILFFAAGSSFTGEDVVEFQCHGSPAVSSALLRALGDIPGLRLADPGEFTRRALENGCLDLAQVEGLSDLIEAETEAQRKQAFRVFEGALGRKADGWRNQLIRAAALLEATIDFADEDVPKDVSPEVLQLVSDVTIELEKEIAGGVIAERVREGFEIAILGPPNVGKSTLLNALAGREAAITSEIAGTTRDVIEVRMELKGLPVTFLDTAGLREATDTVEKIGIDRALGRAESADLRLFLLDSDVEWSLPVHPSTEDIVVLGKADLRDDAHEAVSGLTGTGLSGLIDQVSEVLLTRSSGASLAIRERHRVGMSQAVEALKTTRDALDEPHVSTELIAEDIRVAVRHLESMIGRVDVEMLLDEIFASFCLGK